MLFASALQLQLGCAHFVSDLSAMLFLPQKSFLNLSSSHLAKAVPVHSVFRSSCQLRFLKELDHGLVKRRNIVRTPAANPISIADSLFIFPIATRVANIILDRVVARKLAPFRKAS